jgi:hypothetical protein
MAVTMVDLNAKYVDKDKELGPVSLAWFPKLPESRYKDRLEAMERRRAFAEGGTLSR